MGAKSPGKSGEIKKGRMFFLQALNIILLAVTPSNDASSTPTVPVAQVTVQERANEVSMAVAQKREEPVAANEEKQETEKQE